MRLPSDIASSEKARFDDIKKSVKTDSRSAVAIKFDQLFDYLSSTRHSTSITEKKRSGKKNADSASVASSDTADTADEHEHEKSDYLVRKLRMVRDALTPQTGESDYWSILFPDIPKKLSNFADTVKNSMPGEVNFSEIVNSLKNDVTNRLLKTSIIDAIQASALDAEKNPELAMDAKVRLENSLCKEELEYLAQRREKIKEAFAKFIHVDPSLIDTRDIPTIAIAGR